MASKHITRAGQLLQGSLGDEKGSVAEAVWAGGRRVAMSYRLACGRWEDGRQEPSRRWPACREAYRARTERSLSWGRERGPAEHTRGWKARAGAVAD